MSTAPTMPFIEGYIASQVQRASRNSLIWNGVGLAAIVVSAWLTSNYYRCFFRGPRSVDDAGVVELAARPGMGELLDYVSLPPHQLQLSGWTEQTLEDDKVRSEAEYLLCPIGDDKLLLVLADSAVEGSQLLGPVYAVHRQVDREAFDGILSERPEYAGRLLPIMLNDTAAFMVAGWIGLALGIPWLLLCLWNCWRAIGGMLNPLRHRAVQRLKRFGDPTELAASIDRDMATGPVQDLGKAKLTPLWLLRPTNCNLIAAPLSAVVWSYQLNQQAEQFAMLYFRDGRAMPVPMKAAQIQQLLHEIGERTPWAIRGYSVELAKRWRRDRAAMIAEVDAKRQQHLLAATD